MLRNLSAIFFVFFCSSSFGAPEITPGTIPRYLHIYSSDTGAFVDMAPFGCSGARYNLSSSHPLFKEIFSILLSAQMAKKKVSLRIDGCNSLNQGKIIGAYLEE